MSALPRIATAKADIRKRSCLLYTRKRTCAVQTSMSALGQKRTLRRLRFKEPQIERREHQDNSDVHHQPRPELVPEELNVHANHDAYQREHVKHDGTCLPIYPFYYVLRGGARAALGLQTMPFEECPLGPKADITQCNEFSWFLDYNYH